MKLSIVAALLFTATLSFAAETKIKVQDLPPAVQQTVKDQTKNATLVGVTKEVENGKTEYELETKVGGRSRDLIIDEAGKVTTIEEEVMIASIPAPARAAILKRAGTGKVNKVETVTAGSKVTYEAALTVKGKKSECAVDAAGSPVK